MLAMWCCCPLLMAGGKDMSLPVFIPLNVAILFIYVPTPYLQGFGQRLNLCLRIMRCEHCPWSFRDPSHAMDYSSAEESSCLLSLSQAVRCGHMGCPASWFIVIGWMTVCSPPQDLTRSGRLSIISLTAVRCVQLGISHTQWTIVHHFSHRCEMRTVGVRGSMPHSLIVSG